MLTNAKNVGGAKTGSPGSTAEIVKDVAKAVNQVVEVATTPSGDPARNNMSGGGSSQTVVKSHYPNDSTRVDKAYKVLPSGEIRFIRSDTVPDKTYQKILK